MRNRVLMEKMFIIGIVLIASCLLLGAALYTTIQQPDIHIKDVSLNDINFSEISLEFVVEIYNPNLFGADIKSVDYEIDYITANSEIKRICSDVLHDVSIGAGETKDLKVPIRINIKQIPNLAITLLKNDSINLKVSVTGLFNILGVDIGVPLHEETVTIENVKALTRSAISKIIGSG